MKKFFLSTIMFASMQLFSAHEEINEELLYKQLYGGTYHHVKCEQINPSYDKISDEFQLNTYLSARTVYKADTKTLKINFEEFQMYNNCWRFPQVLINIILSKINNNSSLYPIINALNGNAICDMSINFGEKPSVTILPWDNNNQQVFQLKDKQEAINLAKIITTVFKTVEQSAKLHNNEKYVGRIGKKHYMPFFQLETLEDEYQISDSVTVQVLYNTRDTNDYELTATYHDKKQNKDIREVIFDFDFIRIIDNPVMIFDENYDSNDYATEIDSPDRLKNEARKFLIGLYQAEKKYFDSKKLENSKKSENSENSNNN